MQVIGVSQVQRQAGASGAHGAFSQKCRASDAGPDGRLPSSAVFLLTVFVMSRSRPTTPTGTMLSPVQQFYWQYFANRCWKETSVIQMG